MAIEVLSSNVVNYLVWRYLQEAGYGNAALHLSRCWIRDPDTLPFAPNVQPHALINLLQDGLWFDKLQAEAAGNVERNYQFGRDHGPKYPVRNGSLLTLDQGIPAHVLAEQANGAVQEPQPKRGVKRKKAPKSNGVVEPRVAELVNGDAMDVEPNGATHSHPTNSVRAESEPVASEAESPTVAEIPISTLSIGQSTEIQTEIITDLAPHTTFVPGLKDTDRVIEHTSWGSKEAPVLLTAGKSLLNINMIEAAPSRDSIAAVQTVGLKLPMENYSITALTWNSSNEVTVSAREECSNETGEKMMMDKLIKIIDGGDDYQVISSTAGLVNTLRWNKEKELLLSISTDGERGSIKIWKNSNDSIPAWIDFTDTAIFDALWISDSAFVVCGINLFKIYEVGETLSTQRTLNTQITWETLKYESSSGIIAALGVEGQSSFLGILHPNDSLNLQTHEYPDKYLSDLDFRSGTTESIFAHTLFGKIPSPPTLLSTCSMSGVVRIWDANAPFKCLRRLPTTDDSQAFKVSFSPSGSLLAAAGPDAVTVWDVEKREVPIASWRATEWGSDKWDPGVNGEFSLGWEPNESRLTIALGNQIAARHVSKKKKQSILLTFHSRIVTLHRPNVDVRMRKKSTASAIVPIAPDSSERFRDVALPQSYVPLATTNGASNSASASPFKLHDRPIDSSRRLKVIVIGAGYSGIYLGIRIPEKLRNVELVIYEKNSGLGGTWYENRYLGCACDIPSHSYQYSFEPNMHWSSLYAPAKEIQAYLEGVAKKYSADRFVKLSHEVTECRWDGATAKWYVTVRNLTTGGTIRDQADVLITARGNLNNRKWPDIEGLGSFKGELMHSAGWNESYDWKNKRVGVIGSGSSSIQIVPSLQRLPGTHVTAFARSKTWISPPFGQQLWDKYSFKGFSIPKELLERFTADPEYYHAFRLAVEEDGNGIHAVTIKGTPIQVGVKQMFEENMKQRLESVPHIYDALLPSFSPGCRRLTPGPGYLESLTQPNVAFITSPIERISESAVHTADGTTHTIDALVCATGFHSSSAPSFPVYGADAQPLAQKWANRATTYLSHSIAGFPNLFTMLGPNSAIGSGSLTMTIESVGDYAVKLIRKIQKEDIASMQVKQEREEDFIEYVDRYFEGTVFGENCRSWYKNAAKGSEAQETSEITGLWPGSCLHCIEAMRSPRWEDFEYVYVDELPGMGESVEDSGVEEGANGGGKRERELGADAAGGEGSRRAKGKRKRANRLAWLGNGWTEGGLKGKDLAWYLYPEFQEKPVAPKPEDKERFNVRPFSY
ncbi:hypothetical protein CC80DRAFT_512091 [Byssothecium circinans]|uniref:FAD/NAD(P)-binding domain-containing protein n=1 Tax=Byssothecium circinans TaxID=147558 RepID=A0A6A5UNV2_9PLEO|nr:hypothetical protein CC80DRAFT_512091 [Byssothecium circinans]